MLSGVDVHRLHALQDLAGGGVDVANRLHFIAEQFDPHQTVLIGRTDLEHVALHPETPPGDFRVIAAVLVVDQVAQLAADVEGFTHLEFDRCLEVFAGNAEAVNAAD